MGKKYIIEIEDENFHQYSDSKPSEYLWRVKGFNSLVFDEVGLRKLTPYIAPDLEQVRKAAYEKGFGTGYSKYLNKSYEDGLKDAWEAARRIWQSDNYLRIFKVPMRMDCFTKFSASECIEKIRQYELEQEKIKRGDEVITQSGETIIVTHRLEDDDLGWLDGMGLDGRVYSFLEKNCTKTGKHYSEIAEFFQKMGENNG